MSEQVLSSNSEIEGTLSPNSWKVTVTHRGKNRMKITFKLNQEEASAFKAFQDGVQPEGLSEESLTVEDGEVSLDVPVESSEDEDAE